MVSVFSAESLLSIVELIECAVLKTGHHFVAITISFLGIFRSSSELESALSDSPHPYSSAVSNQFIPP